MNAMNREVYSLAKITRILLDMRNNCVPKESDTYDDPKRNEKYAALNVAIDLINNPSRLVNSDASDGEMSNWISVKERLPEIGQTVLIWSTCIGGVSMWLSFAADDMYYLQHECTHWMPLPEPPKEKVERACATCTNKGWDMPQCAECTTDNGMKWWNKE